MSGQHGVEITSRRRIRCAGQRRRGPRTGGHARARRAPRRQPRSRAAGQRWPPDPRHAARRDRLMSVRVFVADDQEMVGVRAGYRRLLEYEPGIEIVGEAADRIAACELARRMRPDIVPMDMRMRRLAGIVATRRVLADLPRARIVIPPPTTSTSTATSTAPYAPSPAASCSKTARRFHPTQHAPRASHKAAKPGSFARRADISDDLRHTPAWDERGACAPAPASRPLSARSRERVPTC